MAEQYLTNKTTNPTGLWSADSDYVVIPALGSAVIDPDLASQQVVDVLKQGGVLSSVNTSAPANTAVPTVTGTAKVAQVLTATTGTWTGVPAPTFTYQWQVAQANVTGETASTYTVQSGDVGKKIRVRVTGTNTAGNATANSAETGDVIA